MHRRISLLSRLIPALGALFLCLSPCEANDLETIYRLALENDHQFRAARAEYLADYEAKKQGRSALFPSISASAIYEESSSNQAANIGNGIGVFDFEDTTDVSDTNATLNISQKLFDPVVWNDFKSGAASASAAEARFNGVKQSLIIRVSQAYFDTLLAASNLTASLSQQKAFAQQLEQTKQRFDVGLSAITDVYEAQASFDTSVADSILAAGRLNIAFEALEALTGKPFTKINSLNPNFKAVAPQPYDRESWVKRALARNHELRAAEETANASKFEAKSAKSALLPTLSVTGSARAGDRSSFTNPEIFNDTRDDTFRISVNLDVPIYNGGGLSSNARRAAQTAIQQRENYLQMKRDIVQDTRTQHLNVVTGVSTVKARAQSVISRESALESTQAGYRAGTRDLVDVLNAQQALFEARRDHNTAIFDYLINTLNLKDVAGQLTETDVSAINAWLDPKNFVSRTNQ